MAAEVTKDNFSSEVLNADGAVLVDFFAPWCGPCQMLLPIVEELSGELADGQKIVKVNVDDSPEIAQQYGVMSIPALKVFKGGEVVDEAVGVKQKDELKAMLDKAA